MKKLCLLFGLALFLWGIPEPAAAGEGGVEARALWREFQDNETAAEAKYRGKRVTVSGVVVETGISVYATPNVKLSDTATGEIYAVCVLPRADAFKLSQFEKGGRVTLQGVYRHHNNGPLVIKECATAQ